MFRNLKINQRLFLGYLVILAFAFLAGITSILEINHIWKDAKDLYERPLMASNLLRDIKINALNIRRFMLDLTVLNDSKQREGLRREIDLEEANAVISFEKVIELYGNELTGLQESYAYFRSWKSLRDDILEYLEKGDPQKSAELMVTRNREFVEKLFIQLQSAIDTTSQKANALYLSAQETKDGITRSLVLILAFSLLISMFFSWLLTRSISIPLKGIVKNIHEIARGNLSSKKLPESRDEIGQLAASFNRMQEDLAHKASVSEKIANGDFSAHVVPSGESDVVADAINMIADNFDLVVRQARRVAAGDFESEIPHGMKENQLSVVITQMMNSLKEVVENAERIAEGDLSGELIPKSQSDKLANAINRMTATLRLATEQNAKQDRLKTAQNELNEKMRGDLSLTVMANNVVEYLAGYTKAGIGALYLYQEDRKVYELTGSYAFDPGESQSGIVRERESLVGQAAALKKVMSLSSLPEDYIKISSGLGNTAPKNIIIAPFIHEGSTIGVIELGSVNRFSDESFEMLDMVLENIAISFVSAMNRTHLARLFEITKTQAEELQVQQEELRQTNEELEEQTMALRKSEEHLQLQQEELRVTNEDLEQKTSRLEEHKVRMEQQNKDLELARKDIEKKAHELEITNKYKSNFLANMSHELRTPLNSLLILAQTLMDNKNQNLTPQQVESAKIIYSSGNDLLNLINDILDLSRIESGKMNLVLNNFPVLRIEQSLRDYFEHMVSEKGLKFEISRINGVPEKMFSDEQRINQILRNLMSNAIKFTEKGSIIVSISVPDQGEDLSRSMLKHKNAIAFTVKDTGIGIPEEKQLEIFEAFQQVDGSISRKYGGTGLGLSITRELAKLLGGEIKLKSRPGQGSEFTVFLPVNMEEETMLQARKISYYEDNQKTSINGSSVPYGIKEPVIAPILIPSIEDDRNTLKEDDKCILIIDDDIVFAKTLAGICREKGFSYLHTSTGEEGLELASKYLPKGILLDIRLPGIDGWQVLQKLKDNAETRHIPVHMISVHEESREAYNKGAIGYLTKPVKKDKLEKAFFDLQEFIRREIRELLIVECDKDLRSRLKTLLGTRDILIKECSSARRAIELIESHTFDCMVLDVDLGDMTVFEMLNELKEKKIKAPPVIIYTGKDITPEESMELQQYTQNIIIKGVKSEERLLDETSLFLHRVVNEMPEKQRKMLINLHDKDEMFRGKTVLIADDDMRNVFALTQVLEESNMKVIMASNGRKAIEALNGNPGIDLILMDIMMPVMDGYEAMQSIRKIKSFEKLPIIALTAKAMKEDREKSLAAGASDYLTKPVDIDKLFNLMRIWLYQ